MKDSKLIQLVKQLDKAELRTFGKFLKSPYHNSNEKLIIFWQWIKLKAPDYCFKAIEIKRLYKKLYKGEAFDEKKLRQLRFLLLRLLEDFLTIERFKKDDFRFNKEIADVYLDKEMKVGFEKKQQELHKSFNNELFLSPFELHQKLSLHHQAYFNELHVKGDKTPNDLMACTKLLEQYYERQKLFYTVEWLASGSLYKRKIPENIKTYISSLEQRKQELLLNPVQSIFEYAIKLLMQKDFDVAYNLFIQIKELLTKNYEELNKNEKTTLLRLLINYCIKASRKGEQLSIAVFELYQLGLSDGAIFQNGLMTNATFYNIVGTAIKLNKFEWGVNFINKENYRLHEPQNTMYQTLAMATLHFYKKEYINCLMLLSNVESFNHIPVEISKRGLLLRAAFECYLNDKNYAPILNSNIESFNKFLNRKEVLTNSWKDGFSNFVRFLKRLVRKYEKGLSSKDISLMKEFLLEQKVLPIEYKQWLLYHLKVFKEMELQKATP